MPSGVDAKSWIGFEQRVRDRRFRALLETMNHALAVGDAVEAGVALDEARELRPAAPELDEIDARLAALTLRPAPAPAPGFFGARAIGAVALLLTGVTLLMGVDWVRASAPVSPAPPAVEPPQLRFATPMDTPAPETQPATIVPPPADELREPDPIGTTGLQRAIQSPPTVVVPPPTFRQARTQRIPAGEIPDDFVFQPAARTRRLTNGEIPDDFVFQPADGRVQLTGSRQPALSISRQATPDVGSGFSREPTDERRVRTVLNQYARAYAQLDASAARAVWPSVNEGALSRAFAGLASQDVSFDDCQIDVRGVTANASCRGRTSVLGKIGNGVPQTESRTWRFELRRDGDAWKIENAEARRQ